MTKRGVELLAVFFVMGLHLFAEEPGRPTFVGCVSADEAKPAEANDARPESSTTGPVQLTENTLKFSKESPPVEAKSEDFDFLAGYWTGAGLGGDCEEVWMPAIHGERIGTFRFHADGKLVFSEFFQLSQFDGRWSLRLKHFNPTLEGWEEKTKFVEFPLVNIKKNEASFNGLTYRLIENGELHVFLAMKRKDGTLSEEKFVFQKKTLAESPNN